MNAIDVIQRLAQAGFSIALSKTPGNVTVTPGGMPNDLRTLVRDNKQAILDHLREGFPTDLESGAPFMPWCAPISAAQFETWRAQLVQMIEELAELRGWLRADLDEVLTRAINGPASDLRPNWHHFSELLADAKLNAAQPDREQ